MEIINLYHIHDICKHNEINNDELFTYFVNNNIKKVYFLEHYPFGNLNVKKFPSWEKIKIYKQNLFSYGKKYNIQVYFGAECEFPNTNNYYYKNITNTSFDFGVYACHFYRFPNIFNKKRNENWNILYNKYLEAKKYYKKHKIINFMNFKYYYNETKNALKQNIFSWVSHPDNWTHGYKRCDFFSKRFVKKIIKLFIKYDIPIGFSAKEINKLKWSLNNDIYCYFWSQVAKTNIKVIVEIDAHNFKQISQDNINYCNHIIKMLQLEKNIVNDINIKLFNKNDNK